MGKIEDKDIDLHIDRETLLQEYIPKDQYEARLKADLVAILDEFDLRLYEKYDDTDLIKVKYVRQAIQQKINALKGDTNEQKQNS